MWTALESVTLLDALQNCQLMTRSCTRTPSFLLKAVRLLVCRWTCRWFPDEVRGFIPDVLMKIVLSLELLVQCRAVYLVWLVYQRGRLVVLYGYESAESMVDEEWRIDSLVCLEVEAMCSVNICTKCLVCSASCLICNSWASSLWLLVVTLAERSLSARRIEFPGSGSCWVVGSGRR